MITQKVVKCFSSDGWKCSFFRIHSSTFVKLSVVNSQQSSSSGSGSEGEEMIMVMTTRAFIAINIHNTQHINNISPNTSLANALTSAAADQQQINRENQILTAFRIAEREGRKAKGEDGDSNRDPNGIGMDFTAEQRKMASMIRARLDIEVV
jgi:hypothetical protein